MANYNNLPHNDEIEQSILGAMLIDWKNCVSGITDLHIDDFFEQNTDHRLVFSAIKALYDKNNPIDIETVYDYILRIQKKNISLDYLAKLTDKVVSLSNFNYYITCIKQYATLRKLILEVREIEAEASSVKPEEFSSFVSRAEETIFNITREDKAEGFKKASDIAGDLKDKIQMIYQRGDGITGLQTGYYDLDKKINGLQKGALVTLAAFTGVGKTALGLNIVYNVAKLENKPVALFSVEMTEEDNMKRLFSAQSDVPLVKLNQGGITKEDLMKLDDAKNKIAKLPIYIDDTASINLDDLVNKCKKLKNEVGLGLIVVDYIGIVTVTMKTENEVLKIDRIVSRLKALAKELDVPILALAQVNRAVEDRDSGIPELSNLKGSSSIEQFSDQVLFIYNRKTAVTKSKKDYSKLKEEEPETQKTDDENTKENNDDEAEVMEIMIKKNRNGSSNVIVPLLFFKKYQRYDSMEKEAAQRYLDNFVYKK